MLCAYYKPIKMSIFEVVSHSVDFINYLASMWHVCSNKFQFAKLFYCLVLDLVCEILSW
jgi:hypothetical protein